MAGGMVGVASQLSHHHGSFDADAPLPPSAPASALVVAAAATSTTAAAAGASAATAPAAAVADEDSENSLRGEMNPLDAASGPDAEAEDAVSAADLLSLQLPVHDDIQCLAIPLLEIPDQSNCNSPNTEKQVSNTAHPPMFWMYKVGRLHIEIEIE